MKFDNYIVDTQYIWRGGHIRTILGYTQCSPDQYKEGYMCFGCLGAPIVDGIVTPTCEHTIVDTHAERLWREYIKTNARW